MTVQLQRGPCARYARRLCNAACTPLGRYALPLHMFSVGMVMLMHSAANTLPSRHHCCLEIASGVSACRHAEWTWRCAATHLHSHAICARLCAATCTRLCRCAPVFLLAAINFHITCLPLSCHKLRASSSMALYAAACSCLSIMVQRACNICRHACESPMRSCCG